MFLLYCLFALLLFNTPENVTIPVPDSMIPEVALVLQRLALNDEILDPDETKYVMTGPENFRTDLHLIQKRHRECRDLPFVCDALRFPDRLQVSEWLSFNRAYRTQMETIAQIDVVHRDEYLNVIKETDQLYTLWDHVRDSQCPFYYVTVRRRALYRIRETVGSENYYAGILPPYVPVWRFSSRD